MFLYSFVFTEGERVGKFFLSVLCQRDFCQRLLCFCHARNLNNGARAQTSCDSVHLSFNNKTFYLSPFWTSNKQLFLCWLLKMSLVIATASGESEEDEEVNFGEDFVARMASSSSEDATFGDNCLNGIKWPPEHYKKKGRKGTVVVNGFRKLKRTLVTHGGRRSKLPKRFRDSDSESESSLRCVQTKDADNGVEVSPLIKGRNNKICKNGRLNSFTESSGVTKQPRKVGRPRALKQDLEESVVLAENDEFTKQREQGDENSNSTAGYSLDSAHNNSKAVKRKFTEICSENEISINVPKKKRGRKPKKLLELQRFGAMQFEGATEQNGPHGHGDCVSNATKTRLASPSVSNCEIKEKKLKDGVRKRRNGFVTSSCEENSSDNPTRKRRGRPPKHLSPKCEAKCEIFTKNGIRKPWARPVLKSVDKRSLFRPQKKPLNDMLTSSDCGQAASKAKLKSKLIAVNGFVTSLQNTDQVAMPKRRGRPPKIKVEQLSSGNKDVFQFTDEEGSDSKLDLNNGGRFRKLKLHKRPLAPGKPRGLEKKKKLATKLKLKKKAVENAKRTLKVKKKIAKKVKPVALPAEPEVVQSSDNAVHSAHRRRRNKIDRVLGMRRQISGEYEYLVQFKDGTSSWTDTSQLVDYDPDIKQFLSHSHQDLPTVNRLIYKAYWHEDLLKKNKNHCDNDVDMPQLVRVTSNCDNDTCDFEEYNSDSCAPEDVTEDEPVSELADVSARTAVCKEVSVQRFGDSLHIVVSRSSSKRLKINHRILDSLTIALEDASEDDSLFVVIRGLGDETFCGLDIKTVMEIPPEQESRYYRKDMDKLR